MKRSARFSLGTRLALVQALLVIVVMCIFTATLTAYLTKRLDKRTEEDLAQQAVLLTHSLSSYHASLADSVGKLAAVFRADFPDSFMLDTSQSVAIGEKRTPMLRNGAITINQNFEVVDRFTGVTKAVSTVFVRSGDDFIRITTSLKKEDGSRAVGTTLDRSHPAYQKLLNGEEFVGKATLFGKDYMTKYLPVKDKGGNVVAVLFIGLDFTESLQALKEKIRSVKIAKTGYLYAIDATEGKEYGRVQIHPSKEGENVLNIRDADGREFIKEILTQKEGYINYRWIDKEAGETSPREKLVSFRHLDEWNWIICAGASLDELNGGAALLRNAMLGASSLVVVIFVLLFMFMVRRWITRPLREAVAVTEQLASGDFRNVVSLDSENTKSADEVEQLSLAIRRMASSLRGLLEKIDDSSRDVSNAAELVNTRAERIAAGAEEVAAQVVTVATAGEEMTATSVDISRNCQLAVDGAQQASQSARDGFEVVKHTIDGIKLRGAKTLENAKIVESLGGRSDQIGDIVATIEDIADQTNLLALNAAIEAARAGEQGRGFAVVADEVRALAVRTTGATKEIGGMIKTIQSETRQAIISMEEGVKETEQGVVEAARLETSLGDILQRIDDVAMQVNQIATAAEEQTATTGEISGNMHQITQVVCRTSEGAHESASAAAQLNGNAEELQRLLDQFRL